MKSKKISKIRKKSKCFIENHIENRKIEIFKIFEIFDFQYDFQWKIFKNIFEIFEIFKNLEIFEISNFCRKSRTFQLVLMIFF